MRYLFVYLIMLLLGLAAGLSAQNNNWSISAGGGVAAVLESNRGAGVAGSLDLDYRVPVGERTAVVLGLGLQYGSIRDASAGVVPCDFPLGVKVITFSELETYTTHRLDYVNRVGLERRFGKLALRGSLLPTFRLRDRIDYRRVINFDASGRPDQVYTVSIEPGEGIQDGQRDWTIDYSSRFQLQAELAADFPIAERLRIGLGYRRGITDYRLRNLTTSVCGVAGCNPVSLENGRIDARSGSGILLLRFRL